MSSHLRCSSLCRQNKCNSLLSSESCLVRGDHLNPLSLLFTLQNTIDVFLIRDYGPLGSYIRSLLALQFWGVEGTTRQVFCLTRVCNPLYSNILLGPRALGRSFATMS
jgi:hypothetical protein